MLARSLALQFRTSTRIYGTPAFPCCSHAFECAWCAGSYFDLYLLVGHIILDGRVGYEHALANPEDALQTALPSLARVLPTNVVSYTAYKHLGKKETQGGGSRDCDCQYNPGGCRLLLLQAVFHYEALCLHASKFRLARRTTAPNNIVSAVPGAGFLELFDVPTSYTQIFAL